MHRAHGPASLVASIRDDDADPINNKHSRSAPDPRDELGDALDERGAGGGGRNCSQSKAWGILTAIDEQNTIEVVDLVLKLARRETVLHVHRTPPSAVERPEPARRGGATRCREDSAR